VRSIRKILRVVLTLSILLWTVGFILGSGKELTWGLASLAAYTAPISGVLLITMALTGAGEAPQVTRRKAGETLKCIECGRPSVPGSKYCRYHLDIMKDEEQRETY
jgi:hypothetical protein